MSHAELIARLRALPLPDGKAMSETAQAEATGALRSLAAALAASSAPWSSTSRKAVWDVACSIWCVARYAS